MHPNDYNCPFHGLFMDVSTQIIACCAYRCSYLRFSYPFRPRAESATFLFATLVSGRINVFVSAHCRVRPSHVVRTPGA